jgi:hypothetical protein
MKGSINSKFLHRIRIRGGEFDASARAMHRKAAVGNVSIATIERTKMSTKTTLKRVALVAVAAVGFGMLTGVAANAAGNTPASEVTSISLAKVTATPTINVPVVVNMGAVVTTDTNTSTMNFAGALTAYPAGGFVSVTPVVHGSNGTTLLGASDTVTEGMLAVLNPVSTLGVTASSTAGNGSFTFTPNKAGTYTLTVWNDAGASPDGVIGVTEARQTLDIVVSAATLYSAANSTSILNAASTGVTTATVDATIAVGKAASTNAGTVVVSLKDSASAAIAGTVSATISGSGLITVDTNNNTTTAGTLRSSSAATTAGGLAYVHITSDGTAGVGTVTISNTDVNGVTTVLSTETVTFSGAIATLVATNAFTNLAVGANGTNGSSTLYALKVKATDANGNKVADGTTVYATSSDLTKATISASQTTVSGYAYFAVQGVAVGTATITFGEAATSPTVTTTAVLTLTGNAASTVTLAFDKASYSPGEKMVLTLTAKDSTGAGISDGTYTAFFTAMPSANVALQGDLLTANPVIVAGVATYNLYAPLTTATVTITATTGTAGLATAAQGLVISASADVVGDTAAVDAANAATDAANYAADAADAATTAAEEATAAAVAAQDSADAASAAVVALGLRVAVLYAATRTQVLRLQILLVRLIKKLHA